MQISEQQENMGADRTPQKNRLVLVVSRGTSDALYPALIMATTAASQNMAVDMYFTFGAMKIITKDQAESIKPALDLNISQEQLMDLLSKGGMPGLMEMLAMAKELGVRIHACSATMGLYGITKDNLADVCDDVMGASGMLKLAADPSAITFFI
jgi:peroxiredoxin family protein